MHTRADMVEELGSKQHFQCSSIWHSIAGRFRFVWNLLSYYTTSIYPRHASCMQLGVGGRNDLFACVGISTSSVDDGMRIESCAAWDASAACPLSVLVFSFVCPRISSEAAYPVTCWWWKKEARASALQIHNCGGSRGHSTDGSESL